MTLIVGLSGKKRSGKNSVYFLSKILVDEDDTGVLRKVSMADALKEIAIGLGWNEVKDDKGRRLLQLLGTQVCRECIDDGYWVKRAEERIQKLLAEPKPPKLIMIPDIRFPNEVEMVRRLGGELWRVRRPVIEYTQTDTHISETALDNYTDWDVRLIANNMDELFQVVKVQVERLQKEDKL